MLQICNNTLNINTVVFIWEIGDDWKVIARWNAIGSEDVD
jgi:hypothetical protein